MSIKSGKINFIAKTLFSWKLILYMELQNGWGWPLEVIVQTSAQAEHVELVAQDHVHKGFEYQCTHIHLKILDFWCIWAIIRWCITKMIHLKVTKNSFIHVLNSHTVFEFVELDLGRIMISKICLLYKYFSKIHLPVINY